MERWHLIDSNRKLTDKIINRNDYIDDGYYHLVVHLCIFNSNNELLCQLRCDLKENFPNMYDVSVGGSAIEEETSLQAIKRECLEEIGLDYPFKKEDCLYTITDGVWFKAIDDFYIIKKDIDLKTLKLQKEEVQEVNYFNYSQIQQLIKQNKFIPYAHLDKLFDLAKKLCK